MFIFSAILCKSRANTVQVAHQHHLHKKFLIKLDSAYHTYSQTTGRFDGRTWVCEIQGIKV